MSSMAARRLWGLWRRAFWPSTMRRGIDFPAIAQAHHDAVLSLAHVTEAGDEPHADHDQDSRKRGRGEVRPHPLAVIDRIWRGRLWGGNRHRLRRARAEFHHAVIAVGKVRRARHLFRVSVALPFQDRGAWPSGQGVVAATFDCPMPHK